MVGTRDDSDDYASALNAAFFQPFAGVDASAVASPFATVLCPSNDVSRKVSPPGMTNPIDYTTALIEKSGFKAK
jgi:hypothetical protein